MQQKLINWINLIGGKFQPDHEGTMGYKVQWKNELGEQQLACSNMLHAYFDV